MTCLSSTGGDGMNHLDETDTAAAPEGAWLPDQPVQFAGPEPEHACENCARLQAEIDSMRAHVAHLDRQLLRMKSAAANR